MSILVYGEKAGRTHENQMLQAFLERLYDRWAGSEDWIFVIANALWSGTEIDLVCILPSAILVADFKSHGGELTGSENGPWQADGILVKGGSKANPFQQVRDNKFSVLNWLDSKSLLPGRNLGHIAGSVVFSGGIVDRLELPPKVRSWLYPTDIATCVSLLESLGSPELRMEQREAQEIVRRLGVQEMAWDTARPKIRRVESSPEPAGQLGPPTSQQAEVLTALSSFISSQEFLSFSVLGMTSTGKSRLLAYAIDEVRRAGREAIVLEPNRRLADQAEFEATSIYAHLYSGRSEDEDAEAEEKSLKVIPLRLSDDPTDCVYLIDDAHLIGNSRFTTPDGKQYGSGQLLGDFFDFAELGKSKRKVILFGDHYQIQRSADDDSALLGTFQQKRNVKHQSVELNQLIDATGGSARLVNAERLVSSIRSKRFAALALATDDGFRQMDRKTAATEMLERFRFDPLSASYLAETHAKTNALTRWIRERLFDKRVLDTIEPGDLLEIYVSPEARDPTKEDSYRRVDGRQQVASVGARRVYSQGLTWAAKNPVTFHSIDCGVGERDLIGIKVFEDFLIAEKPELEKETAVAESVWRKGAVRAHNEALKRDDSHQALIQLPPDFVYARFGYASTVHHAQGVSYPICYVNCDHAAGRHSDAYFRWLYSALTVGEREVVLVNFAEIHPFDGAIWNASSVALNKEIAFGAGWSFNTDGVMPGDELRSDLPSGLEQSRDFVRSAAIFLRIARVIKNVGWRVSMAQCYPYQEQYGLVGPDGEQSALRVSYNGKNAVTAMHIDDPVFWPLLAEVAAGCTQENSLSTEASDLSRCIRSRGAKSGWWLGCLTETPYRLSATLARRFDERAIIEVNFDKQGLVSSLRLREVSDLTLIDEIKGVFA